MVVQSSSGFLSRRRVAPASLHFQFRQAHCMGNHGHKSRNSDLTGCSQQLIFKLRRYGQDDKGRLVSWKFPASAWLCNHPRGSSLAVALLRLACTFNFARPTAWAITATSLAIVILLAVRN